MIIHEVVPLRRVIIKVAVYNESLVLNWRETMLNSTVILNFLKRHKREFETRFSVTRIGLFGSVLHGTADETSDVDILVELSSPTFDNYMDLKFFLEDHFKRPVDLVLADCLKPRIEPVITSEVSYAWTS